MHEAKTTNTANADAIRAYRHARVCVSVRFAPDENEKRKTLCSFVTTRQGNSTTAIVRALVSSDPITAKVDESVYGLLGKNIGLLKLAATVFPIRLPVDPIIRAIEALRAKILHAPTAPRTSARLIPSPYSRSRGHRMSIHFPIGEYTRLSELAALAGMSRSAYIRALVTNKEITSRISLSTANEIKAVGTLLLAFINAEKERQVSGNYGAHDGGIFVVMNEYKKLLLKIKDEIQYDS